MRYQKWTNEELTEAVKNSTSIRAVIQKLGLIPAGGNYVQIQSRIKLLAIDTSHFTGSAWSKRLKLGPKDFDIQIVFENKRPYQSYKLKKRLFQLNIKQQNCEECKWSEISSDGRIPLELDHINGNPYDNRLENLRILCPNCHSLKPTHRGRNKKCPSGGMVDT